MCPGDAEDARPIPPCDSRRRHGSRPRWTGALTCLVEDEKTRRIWLLVITMGWNRGCCVEMVRRAETAAFTQCHVNAFEYLGRIPSRFLYDPLMADIPARFHLVHPHPNFLQ